MREGDIDVAISPWKIKSVIRVKLYLVFCGQLYNLSTTFPVVLFTTQSWYPLRSGKQNFPGGPSSQNPAEHMDVNIHAVAAPSKSVPRYIFWVVSQLSSGGKEDSFSNLFCISGNIKERISWMNITNPCAQVTWFHGSSLICKGKYIWISSPYLGREAFDVINWSKETYFYNSSSFLNYPEMVSKKDHYVIIISHDDPWFWLVGLDLTCCDRFLFCWRSKTLK